MTGLFVQAVGIAVGRDDAERAVRWQAACKATFARYTNGPMR